MVVYTETPPMCQLNSGFPTLPLVLTQVSLLVSCDFSVSACVSPIWGSAVCPHSSHLRKVDVPVYLALYLFFRIVGQLLISLLTAPETSSPYYLGTFIFYKNKIFFKAFPIEKFYAHSHLLQTFLLKNATILNELEISLVKRQIVVFFLMLIKILLENETLTCS